MKNLDGADVLKGAAAGLIGGLAASFLMSEFQSLVTAITEEKKESRDKKADEPATVKAAEAISEGAFDHSLTPQEKEVAGPAVHYAMGGISGLMYGAAVEIAPVSASGAGLPFGTAVWLIADDVVVPALGFSKPADQYPFSTHFYAFSSHLVYGFATD